jgi:hypothetical protein
MTMDIPNAFVRTDLNLNVESMYMKIRRILVDMLFELNPEVCNDYIIYEREHKVIYVRMMKTSYGMPNPHYFIIRNLKTTLTELVSK